MLLLQISFVSSAADNIIKLSFIINDKDHIELEKFDTRTGEYKNFAESPSLFSIQIKDEKGELIEKSNFAPAFFILSKGKLTKINETEISKEFLYKGDKWKFLEVYKEDKLLYQADIEKKFCDETKLCSRWIKITFYVIPIIIILLLLAYLFFRKRKYILHSNILY